MFNKIKYLVVIFFLFNSIVFSASNNLSLDLQDVNLLDAILTLSKFLQINMVVSPAVTGKVNLHLRGTEPQQVLRLLLRSHGLGYMQMGNALMIAPRDELIKLKSTELQWQELDEASAPIIMRTWRLRYANAQSVAHLLQEEHSSMLSKRGRVQMDIRTNILCIADIASRMHVIADLVNQLDVPIKQIAIEARLISVDNDFERELGLQFSVNSPIKKLKKSVSDAQGQYSLAVARLADGSFLDLKLAALEKEGHAELISSPSLFTSNQQSASIEAGEEVPYQEVSEGGGTAVTFKKAVLSLKVTPQVLPGNNVLLQLQINQDRPSNKMVLGVPTISTRQIITNILAKSGETVVLGGIFEANEESGQKRLPFFNQIPVLGWLFKQQIKRQNKRELLIFVTPRVIV